MPYNPCCCEQSNCPGVCDDDYPLSVTLSVSGFTHATAGGADLAHYFNCPGPDVINGDWELDFGECVAAQTGLFLNCNEVGQGQGCACPLVVYGLANHGGSLSGYPGLLNGNEWVCRPLVTFPYGLFGCTGNTETWYGGVVVQRLNSDPTKLLVFGKISTSQSAFYFKRACGVKNDRICSLGTVAMTTANLLPNYPSSTAVSMSVVFG